MQQTDTRSVWPCPCKRTKNGASCSVRTSLKKGQKLVTLFQFDLKPERDPLQSAASFRFDVKLSRGAGNCMILRVILLCLFGPSTAQNVMRMALHVRFVVQSCRVAVTAPYNPVPYLAHAGTACSIRAPVGKGRTPEHRSFSLRLESLRNTESV